MKSLSPISGLAMLVYRHRDGRIGWRLPIRNGVTTEGVNWLLDTAFLGIVPVQAVYCGIIANTGYLSSSASDTHNSHSGWTELASLLSPTRPTWVPQAAASGVMGTTTPASFTFVGAGFLRGIFLSSINTVGSVAAGVLYNTAVAVSPLAYADGGTLDVSFTPRLLE